jgi:hypothetical protein
MSGYITLLSNKIFQVYGSDVYMLCFTEDLETLTNIENIFLDSNQIHFQSHVADIEMLQRRVNNELNYNKLNSKKQFFMLPNLNNIKELIRDLINEQTTIKMFENPINKSNQKNNLDKDYNTTEDTDDLDKKTFRELLKVKPNNK